MAGESRDGIEINGVAHVILRVKRIRECIAFYDLLMPFLGLNASRRGRTSSCTT